MKIFVIGARGFPNVQGGIESHCEELCPRLVNMGYKVTALTIKQYTQIRNWKGIVFISIPSLSSKYLQKPVYNLLSALYCVLRRPDIVHVHGLNAGLFIWLFKLFGLKVVATYHSMDYLYPKWNLFVKIMLKYSEKQFLLSDYIITVSKPYLEHFMKKGRNHAINYLPNGVNLLNKRDEKNNEKILKKWNLKENEYILAVGRITPEKDYATLIKAFNLANLDGIKLVIVGSEEFEKNYYKKLKQISNENVIFTGQLNKEDLSVLYSRCRIFIISSLYEGLPNSLLEAMSYNCNILASDIEAHISLGLEHDDFFKAGNANDLAYKIKKKYLNNEKRDFSKLIIKNYNWDNITEEVDKIYKAMFKSSKSFRGR